MLLGTMLAAPDLRVAYTARYYYPAGDKRTSHTQVYLCDTAGKNRKAITSGAVDCGAVRWTGPKSLAWIVERGTRSELWATTVGGKAQRLRTGATLYALCPVSRDLGGKAAYHIDGKEYTLAGTTLTPLPAAKPQPTLISFAGPGGAKLTVDWSNGVYDWRLLQTRADKSEVAEDHDNDNVNFVRTYPQQPDGSVWLVTFSGNSTTGGSWMVNRYDWTSGKSTAIAAGTDLDFRLDRDLWAAVSPRDLSPLGGGEVWTSQATIGSRKTGKQTALGSGTVYFTSISLR